MRTMMKLSCCILSLLLLISGCGIDTSKLISSSAASSLSVVPCAITKLKLALDDDIYIQPGKPCYETMIVEYESTNKDDYKNIVWVSSDPNVAQIQNSAHTSDSLYGKIVLNGEGSTYLYAQTADGSITSDKIIFACGKKEEGKCYIHDLKAYTIEGLVSSVDVFYIKQGTDNLNKRLIVEYKSPYEDDYNNIIWVSSNPEIATVSPGNKDAGNFMDCNISIISTGKIDVYAQTKDGTVVSNKIHLEIGNVYNKQNVIRDDMIEYVFDRLKYNMIIYVNKRNMRPAYYAFREYFMDSKLYKYFPDIKISKVYIDDVVISEDNSADITGHAITFTEGCMGVTCNFKIKLQYNEDFTSYQVISEKYDMPEVIRDKLD